MKKKYETKLEEKEEKRTIYVEKKELLVTFYHNPNVVGPRSTHTGLPIWVGETVAKGSLDGGTVVETIANCWVNEPYTYTRARVVSAGRLLKQLKLPTELAEQMK